MESITIESCNEFVEELNSKLDKGTEPRYHTARVYGFARSSDLVHLRIEGYYVSVEVQNHHALSDFKTDLEHNDGMSYSIVVYDEEKDQILMPQLPEEDWYICHIATVDEGWEQTKKQIREAEQERIRKLEERRPLEDKEYYLCPVNTDEGLGYEVYASYDYVRLTNQPGKGTPVIFEKLPGDGNLYESYHIRMTESNYAGYNYFSGSNKGWIYLAQEKNASEFIISYNDDTGISMRIAGAKGMGYLKAKLGKGRTWLTSDSQWNVGDLYTLIPAN
ncbi:hypothetical protein ABE049_19235 [Priestia megaterium]